MAEDLVAAAFNDAKSTRMAAASQERMGDVAGGMNLPPGFRLPFSEESSETVESARTGPSTMQTGFALCRASSWRTMPVPASH